MSGGGVPANTSSTTTINQSPWQNKTYRTLALGTPGNLGPVAQQLKIGQQLTQDWMDIQSGRNPGLYYGLQNATPERLAQENALRDVGFAAGRAPAPAAATPTPADTPTTAAAQGGLMSLRGFAPGGQPGQKQKTKPAVLARPEADKNESGLTTAQQTQWDKLEKLRNSGGKMTQQQIKAYNNLKGIRTTAADAIAADPTKQNKPTGAPFSYSDLATPTAFLDPKTGQNMLPDAQLAYQRARELSTPQEIDQASKAYNDAVSNLERMANYQAKDVNAQRADVYGYDPAMAQASSYQAARMTAPEQAAVKDYEAAQMNAATMQGREAKAAQANRGDIRDIAAQMADVERYNAAQIERTQREQAATTQGPKSWTDPGVAQQYMSPYQQAVTDIAKRESMRDYGKQLSQLRSQATQSKAYGGTRQALQEAEAQRGQAQRMGDIEAQGLQQAYQSGMGQFSAEQGLGAQVGMSNTQQINQLKQQYMQMGLSEAQANQAAINQASQINAAAQNTAYNNYVAQQLQAQQANQAMDWNVANLNTQNQQQAELANQQYGLGGFQSNLNNAQFAQQAAQQNQAAINQQRSQYVNNALQAAMQAYGGQLTAEQQNQVAQNAASQFNAGNQQQVNLANQASQNAASQLYANAQNQAGLQYAQQNLQGQMANQQAGLQANQQNLGAWGQVGSMAQGLGGLGATRNQIQLNNLGALGQSATAQTNYAQGALDRNTQNAMNWYNLPATFNAPGINALNAQQVNGGTNQSQQWYNQAKPFAKGGKVQWGPKK